MVKLVVKCGPEEQRCSAVTIAEVITIATKRWGDGMLEDSEGYALVSPEAFEKPLEDGMTFSWIRACPSMYLYNAMSAKLLVFVPAP
jgi:hypothetical protein